MKTQHEILRSERREQIISVAAELFACKNYHEVLMDEVAERSGLSKGTLYNYFSNKEDLHLSIMTHRLELLLNVLRNRVDTRQTPLINLRRIIIHIYSFMAKYPNFFQIWYREKLHCQRHSHQSVQSLYRQIKDLLILALERGIQEEILRPHASSFVADIVMGIIDSAVLRSAHLTDEERREERVRVFEFVLDAIGTEQARQLHQAGEDNPQKEEDGEYVVGR